MEDQRVFERITARFPMRFLDPSNGKEGQAETIDVSANGLGFITRDRVPVATPLEMWLEIPDQRDPLYVRGKVAWSAADSSTRQHVGVSLENARLMSLARVLWLKRGS